ncbi:carbohydrate-binding module family 1 protein [Moniliophthora roreri MCA 2997]|uniref:Carbohydrate-binding module family 1 protein n=1 Tax=Moniliophthora roreri (strain MCA 2997) TaxID=1381753 RepID=V2WD10_MONRO|nr:carbohydrate-binding module family 1 protein [Moniliophthora roreri MCA 2997]
MLTDHDFQASTCSACSIKENKSNYWKPTLYFQSPKNGTFKRVTQPGSSIGDFKGGMVVYYIQVGQVTAFPKGFRMISGDPYLHSYNSSINGSRSIMMRCLETDLTSGKDYYGMPTTKCKGGVRSQINFPTCWDGKNVDTPNHKDHVRYAIGASFGNFGQGCPSTHPVQLPLLFLETVAVSNHFVWAMGDPTGFGYHGDYMMGCPADTLKAAMAQCNDAGGQISACPVLTSRSEQEMNDYAVPNRVEEDLGGWLTELPGCNPIYKGPGRAPLTTGCGAPETVLPKDTVTFLKSDISGWTLATIAMMSIEKRLNYCNTQKLSYAGIKGTTCSNSVNTSKFSKSYACDKVCTGNSNGTSSGFFRIRIRN